VVGDDIRERVASYLAHQATKETAYLRSLIERERMRLLGAPEGLSEAQASWKPQPDEWSVKEVLRHVCAAERSVVEVVTSLAAGATPQGGRETGRQDPDESATLGELVDRLRGERQRLLAFLDSLPPSADLSVTFPHPFFGPLNFKGWVAFQRVHDGDHINQIESIKATNGFPRS
jgi:uncharacterized damage-inducible protein DinB